MNEVECVNVFCRNFHDETAARWDAAAPKKTEELTTGAQVRDKYFDPVGNPFVADRILIEDDTDPQLNLDDLLKAKMLPFGQLELERYDDRDEYRVTLFNPPTGLYISTSLSHEYVKALGPQQLASFLSRELLSELQQAHGRDMHMSEQRKAFSTQPIGETDDTVTYKYPKDLLRNWNIGTTLPDGRMVVGMDRCEGTLTLRKAR